MTENKKNFYISILNSFTLCFLNVLCLGILLLGTDKINIGFWLGIGLDQHCYVGNLVCAFHMTANDF